MVAWAWLVSRARADNPTATRTMYMTSLVLPRESDVTKVPKGICRYRGDTGEEVDRCTNSR